MCICIVCVYVCIHVMRVVRLPHKLTYCFFPFSWGPNPFGGGGGPRNRIPGSYIHIDDIYIYNIPLEARTETARLPFVCRMVADAASAHAHVAAAPGKDGKCELLLPVAFPDEGDLMMNAVFLIEHLN